MQTRVTAAVVIAITVAGLVYVLAPRVSPLESMSYDSYRYLAGAESIAREGRYLDLSGAPQRTWPPGLSLLYAIFPRPESAVPAVNAVAFAVTALFLALLAKTAAMRWWAAGAMTAAVLLNSAVLAAHRKLWSEPPVLALLVAILWCVLAKRDSMLIAATALASIAIVFRFAMVATVLFLFVAFLLYAKRKWLAPLAVLAPVPSWLIARALGAAAGSSRVSAFDPGAWSGDLEAVRSLADQLFPVRLLGALAIVATLAAIVLAVWLARGLAAIAGLWIACYGGFLLLAQAVASPSFTLDLRILLPMYVAIAIALAAAASTKKLGILLIVPLLLVPIRGARQFFEKPEIAKCVSREQFAAALRARRIAGPISTNAAGLVWYATRQRIVPRGGTAVWLDAGSACGSIVETSDAPPPGAVIVGYPVNAR